MEWIEVIVPTSAAEADDIAALLVDEVPMAAAGAEVRGDEVVFWAPLVDGEAARAQAMAAVARWAAGGAAVDPATIRLEAAMPEAEWRDAWKKYFKVARITRAVVVVPSWEPYQPLDGDVVLELDPGMAFGTGTHATTRVVLEEMQTLADEGQAFARVLDVGAGSGILTIAAVKLWPTATAVATDNDPIAVTACRENAAHNRVDHRITCHAEPLAHETVGFPLVLANIQAHVLRELKAELVRLTLPGGTLILSGLLTPQAAPLADEFVAAGMTIVRARPSATDPAWSVVTLQKP